MCISGQRPASVYDVLQLCVSKQGSTRSRPIRFHPCTLCVCVCVCARGGKGWECPEGCGSGRLELSTHTHTHTDMQQLANKDEFCCVWQRFSRHYFPLCPVRIPDLSSCLSCKDTLSGSDSSSRARTHLPNTHTRSGRLPLTVVHMWGTYAAICLTSAAPRAASCTPAPLCRPPVVRRRRRRAQCPSSRSLQFKMFKMRCCILQFSPVRWGKLFFFLFFLSFVLICSFSSLSVRT